MTATDVLDFWFSARAREHWWHKDQAFDDEIRARFGTTIEDALAGQLGEWAADADGALALVIVLDQFTRNVFRGSPRSFAGDARALKLAKVAIENGFDKALSLERQSFLYLPFQHSESLEDQLRSVEVFSRWVAAHDEAGRESARGDMEYVHRHHEIIQRFGRFPHRNKVLGRESTPEEIAFLTEPNSSF